MEDTVMEASDTTMEASNTSKSHTDGNKKEKEKQQSSAKKNKKKKNRCLTFFRGPKCVVYESLRVCDDNNSETNHARLIKQSLIAIMKDNLGLKLHHKNNNLNENEKDRSSLSPLCGESSLMSRTVSNNSWMNESLSHQLIFGCNAVIRAIKTKRVVGVLLSDHLAIQLHNNIIDLCIEHSVAVISVSQLHELASHFGVSSLSVMALKPSVATNIHALFHPVYQTLISTYRKLTVNKDVFSLVKQTKVDTVDNESTTTIVEDKEEKNVSLNLTATDDQLVRLKSENINVNTKELSTIVMNSSNNNKYNQLTITSDEILYTKANDCDYYELMNRKLSHLSNINVLKTSNYDAIASQDSFLPIASTTLTPTNIDVYMPERDESKKQLATQFISRISIQHQQQEIAVSNNDTHSLDVSFAENLMEVSLRGSGFAVEQKQQKQKKQQKNQKEREREQLKRRNSNKNRKLDLCQEEGEEEDMDLQDKNKRVRYSEAEIVCLEPSSSLSGNNNTHNERKRKSRKEKRQEWKKLKSSVETHSSCSHKQTLIGKQEKKKKKTQIKNKKQKLKKSKNNKS